MSPVRGTCARTNSKKRKLAHDGDPQWKPRYKMIPAPGIVWKPSSIRHEDLEKLLEDGLLQPQAVAGWRADPGMARPFNEINEIVVFTPFYERRFSIPAHDFLRGLLFFYGLELIHLDPNSILQLSLYIHLCEAILGIDPPFHLWRHLFHVVPDQSTVVRGVTFQVRQGASKTTSSSN